MQQVFCCPVCFPKVTSDGCPFPGLKSYRVKKNKVAYARFYDRKFGSIFGLNRESVVTFVSNHDDVDAAARNDSTGWPVL